MTLVELPFELPGRIFRSPMPFSGYDFGQHLLTQYQQQSVGGVVLLVDDEHCLAGSGRDLRQLYGQNGRQVIYLPIPDFGVPAMPDLEKAVEDAVSMANRGTHLVVHCYAGLGRTGMFLACLARRVLGLSADEAIRWVRSYLPGAIETTSQLEVIRNFQGGNSDVNYER